MTISIRILLVAAALLAVSTPTVSGQIPGGSGIVINSTPVSGGTNTNCLYVNGSVVGNQACGGAPSGAAGGGLSGTYPNPSVVGPVNGNTVTAGTGTLTLGSVTLNAGAGGTLGSNAFTSTSYLPLSGGTLTGALLFTDNSFDIGAAGATRPRAGYFGTSITIGAGSAITSSGAGGALGSNAFTSTSYMPLAGGTFSGGIGFSTTNTLDVGTNATTLAPRTVYAGTSFVGPIGTFTTSAAVGGATIGANALAVTGASQFNGAVTNTGDATIANNNFFVSASTGQVQAYNGAIYCWSSTTSANGVCDSFWRRGGAAATFVFGTTDASVPAGQNLRVQNVLTGTSNGNAPNWMFMAALSTGSGTNGDFIFQTGGTGAGATVQNTATTALTIKGGTQIGAFSTAIMIGSATPLTLTSGALGMQKMTASASAPGAAGTKIEAVCGTNAGTAKLVMYAGTSGTAVTVVDNVGAGVSGC